MQQADIVPLHSSLGDRVRLRLKNKKILQIGKKDFDVICITLSWLFLNAEMDKLILKLIWKFKGPMGTKTVLKKITWLEDSLSDFRTYYRATVIKTVVLA